MTQEIKPYHIIEGYLTTEQCAPLTEYFLANEGEDPREFYGNLSLGGYDRFVSDKAKDFQFDSEKIIHSTVAYAKEFFLKNYKMVGTFEINRAHANYMHEGAELAGHTDYRKYDEPVESLNTKTYVCGLFLTDDYEGGELYFEDIDVALKPKVGDLVFFPGFYTRHAVKKVTKGTRVNVLIHFFDTLDEAVVFVPDHKIAPPATSKAAE